ncbi:MAG TPA: hypothetical protein VJT73_13185 [Polyangiaceae bacterium]|nr:hypothetical protein [Polyangiaceae bacterium]
MSSHEMSPDIAVAYAVAGVLTVLAVAVDEAVVGWILALPILACLYYTMIKQPLRSSLLWIMFFALTLENPSELPAAGHWQSPLYVLGALLLNHMNGITGVPFLFFSGLDMFLGSLIVIAIHRRMTGSPIDRAGRLPTPKPLIQLATISLAGTAFVWLTGWLRGGNNTFAVWQIYQVFYLPVVFLLYSTALRGPKDCAALARVMIGAALVRACVAVYVNQTISLPPDPEGNTHLPYATSHADSITFAIAFVLIVSLLIHRVKGARKIALLTLPILVAGMLNNNRRMVWVQIGLVLVTLYFANPMNAMKYKLRKVVWVLTPFVALYIVAGWNHPTGVFKPVATIRSVVDPSTDLSAQTREIENYDLMCTLKANPLLGVGYGNRYLEVIGLLPMGHDLEPYIPHNSVLGLWAYAGLIGYSAMTLLWAAGVYFATRAYKFTKKPQEQAAALMSYAPVLVYLVQCWGDMGLGSTAGVFTVGPAIAMGGKLAVATGAWELTGRRAKRQAAEKVASKIPVTPAGVGRL